MKTKTKKRKGWVKVPVVDREYFEKLVDRLWAENPGKTRDECYLLACYALHYPGEIKPGNIEVPPGEYPVVTKGEMH